MALYHKFKRLHIDHAAIGLDLGDPYRRYFCTPKDARVFAWAGVEGIHYCFLKGHEEMVFAVSPSNLPGDHVHPIARSFEDMLRLLLACGSMDAIEQAHLWDVEQFTQYVRENPPTETQREIMDVLRKKYGLTPMEGPFSYIKELQRSFDYEQIIYSADYYREMDALNPKEPEPPVWKVCFEGGFWPERGRAGKELRVDQKFSWGEEIWHVPAVYVCTEGMVIDFCIEVDPIAVRAFIEKWDLIREHEIEYTDYEQDAMRLEHPLNMDFKTAAEVNGLQLRQRHRCAVTWIPEICFPGADTAGGENSDRENLDGELSDRENTGGQRSGQFQTDLEAKWILEHYGYDLSCAWSIQRVSLPWADKRPRIIKSLVVNLEREKDEIPGNPFVTPAVGESIAIVNPVDGREHILTVRDYESCEMDPSHFHDDSVEYPTHYGVMTYTIYPELRDFYMRDCDHGDAPRRKQVDPYAPVSVGFAAVMGVMRGGQEQKEYIHPDGSRAQPRMICSSMHFEPVGEVTWNMVFREKRMDDVEVKLV